MVGGIGQNGEDILTVEHISETNNTCNVTDMEKTIDDNPMVFTSPISGNLLVCGGNNNRKRCLTPGNGGQWTNLKFGKFNHSLLNFPRRMSAAATTKEASYIFGGNMGYDQTSYEYMFPSDKIWREGKEMIPDGFENGCAVTISNDEIWLIGGDGDKQRKRVLSFNTTNHTFIETNIKLARERKSHRCSLMPDKSGVMVTGGTGSSTEIIDLKTRKSTETGSMTSVRSLHGIGTLVIDDTPTLVVFGGYTWASGDRQEEYFTSFEKYDEKNKSWSLWDGAKLKTPRREFGFTTLKQTLTFCKDEKK